MLTLACETRRVIVRIGSPRRSAHNSRRRHHRVSRMSKLMKSPGLTPCDVLVIVAAGAVQSVLPQFLRQILWALIVILPLRHQAELVAAPDKPRRKAFVFV